MNDSQKHWAGMFGGLRVPFDCRMIIIGFLAIIVFLIGNYIINIFAEEPYLLTRSIDYIFRSLGTTAHNFFHTVYNMLPGSHAEVLADEIAPNIWACGATLLWGLIIVVWFGALISRLTALRIAKEEKAHIVNAIRFVWRRKLSLLLTPITIVILFALLYACNWILGCIGTQMTAAGTVVFILLFILVLIASFFMVCLSILLLFGVHLIPACIATEGCDGIETFISIFNYMFVRPWSYILYNVMIVFSLIFLVFAGGMFLDLVYQSSQISVTQDILSYHFDKVDNFVRVNYASLEGKSLPIYYLKQDALEKAVQQYESFSPEEQAKRTKPCFYSAGMRDVWAYISGAMVDSWILDPVQNETVRCEHKMSLRDLWKLSKFWTCIATILSLIYCIIFYGLCGYLFAYVFMATTTVYFLLRKEVDDINFDEVWDEEKHREFLKTLKTVQKKTLSDYESMFSKHTKQEAENTVVQKSEETKNLATEVEVKITESVEEKQEEVKENLVPEEKQEEVKENLVPEEKQEEVKATESVEEKQEEVKATESVEEKQEEKPNITSEEESRKERKRKKLQLMKNKLEAARAKANENNLENKQEETAQQQEENKQLENQEAVQEENKQLETAQLEIAQQQENKETIQEENRQEETAQQQENQETVQEENKQLETAQLEQETVQEENKQLENTQEAVQEENKQLETAQLENTQEEIAQQQENTQEAIQEENKQEENAQQQENQETVQEENKQEENAQQEQETVQEENKQEENAQQEQETVQEENKQLENAQQQENTQDNIAQEQETVQEEKVQKTEAEAQAPVQEESTQEDTDRERENTRKIAQEFAQSIAKVDEEQITSQEDTKEKPQEETSKNVTARFRHMPDFIPEPDTKPEPKKMPDFIPEPDTVSEAPKTTEPAIAEDSGSSDWDNFTFDSEPTPPKEKEEPPIEDEDSHSKIKLESGTMSIPLMTRPRYKYSARRRMEHSKNDFKKDDFID